MKKRRQSAKFLQCTMAMALALAAEGAGAGPIIGPTAVRTNMGYLYSAPNVIINQAGLYGGYVSGETDFDDYTERTLHQRSLDYAWVSQGIKTGWISFDLGQLTTIDAIALWQFPSLAVLGVDYGVGNFSLFAGDNLDPASFNVLLGDFSLGLPRITTDPPPPVGVGRFATYADVFRFDPITTRYVHMQVTSNRGTTNFASLAEVVFSKADDPPAPLPEPGPLALLAVGAIGLGIYRRRPVS